MVVSAALTKLSCLLANADLSVQEIRKEMSRSIRGELTEQSEIHFAHPNSFLPPKVSSLTALGYAVANGSHEEITAIIKETKEFLLNEFDYSGNTPLVSDIFDFLVSSFPFASSRGYCSRLCLSSNEGIGRKANGWGQPFVAAGPVHPFQFHPSRCITS